MLPIEQTFIFLVIFTFWVIRLYYKLYDVRIRKYVMVIGILIVFWMLIRINKGLIDNYEINRLFWYLYYVPLIFIPSYFYICVFTLLNKITRVKKVVVFVISCVLFIFILTNDFHQLVFKFPDGIDNYNNYKHFIGYYLTCFWIFYLFGSGMIKLAISKIRVKRSFKAFTPLILLVLGILYTCFYVMGVPLFRSSNLSVILSVLICLGIELILYLDLIPNNSKYRRTFEGSHLDMIVVSLDSNTMYNTKSFREIPEYIYNDIKNGNVKRRYRRDNVVYDVIDNKDSYVCFRNDVYELNLLKKRLKLINKELLFKQRKLRNEEAIKRELYEIRLREEVVCNLEKNLEAKKESINSILNKNELSNNDIERVKLLVSYCKRKSSLIISELNDDMYNDVLIKVLIKELFTDSSSLGISGEVVVAPVNISSYEMSLVYDIIFNIIENIRDAFLMVFITYDDELLIRVILSGTSSVKDSLKFVCTERVYDNDVELIFNVKVGSVL